MPASIVMLALLVAPPLELPHLKTALSLLRDYHEGVSVSAIGPVSLNGFNFYRVLKLGPQSTALVISTLWDSGILLYDGRGDPKGFITTAEVTRLWVADLDQDGTMEILTDERVGRGTGIQVYEFRLYRAAAGTIQRLWRAESYRMEAALSSVGMERRSYVRIERGPKPRLEYRRPCGTGQCTQHLVVAAGKVRQEVSQ